MYKIKENKPTALIAYHDHCIDGYTSAYITKMGLNNRSLYSIELPMQHSSKESEERLLRLLREKSITQLFVVDFSLSLDLLKVLKAGFSGLDVFIYDHHKTAFEMYAPEVEVTRTANVCTTVHGAQIVLDNNECGASLCRNIFFPGRKPSILIQHVRDRDLWIYDFGDATRYLHHYLLEQPKTISAWTNIDYQLSIESHYAAILDEGRRLYELEQEHMQKIAAQYRPIKLYGTLGGAVQCKAEYASEVGNMIAERTGTFGLMYSINIDKNTIKYSLRSIGDFDVSRIAKMYGGGGHMNAAGFELPLVPEFPTPREPTQEAYDEVFND